MTISPTFLILETQNFGFRVEISLQSYEKLKDQREVTLFTYLHYKKDGQSFSGIDLYGFVSEEERWMFEQLISVSGIGANTARVMQSGMSAGEIRGAILTDNESKISSVKGIGPKTAKRLILELKDKMLKSSDDAPLETFASNNVQDEALIALTALGFQKNAIQKAFTVIGKENLNPKSVEELIKHALRIL